MLLIVVTREDGDAIAVMRSKGDICVIVTKKEGHTIWCSDLARRCCLS